MTRTKRRPFRELHCKCGDGVIADVSDTFVDAWLAEHREHDPQVRDPRHAQPDIFELLEAE